MSKKSAVYKILIAGGMLAAMGGMPMPSIKGIGAPKNLPVVPEKNKKKFIEQYNKFLLRLKNHNNERNTSKKSKWFTVQGFSVCNFSEKNAKKKLRQLLGHTFLHTDTTKEVGDELLELFTKELNAKP